MFLNKIKNIFCVPETKFVSATNVERAGKRGNICVGNSVSATMCPRLPGPYVKLKMTANYSRSNGQKRIKLDGPNGEKFGLKISRYGVA